MILPSLGPGELFAIGSSLTYSGTLICVRQGMRTATPTAALFVIAVVVSLAGLAAAAVQGTLWALTWKAFLWFAATGILGMGVGNLMSFVGVQRMGVSRSTPVTDAAPLWGAAFAVFFLGERPGPPVLGGTVFIVAGVALLSVSFAREESKGDWFTGAMVFPLTASVILAFSPIMARWGYAHHPDPMTAMGVAFAAGSVTLLAGRPLLGASARLGVDRRALAWFLGGAVFNALASACIWSAFLYGEISKVLPLSRLTPVWVVAWSWLFLGRLERITWRVVLAAALVVGGGVLVTAFR